MSRAGEARAMRKVVAAICGIEDDAMTFATRVPESYSREGDVYLLLTMKDGTQIEIDIRPKRRTSL